MNIPIQLPLNIQLRDDALFSNFFVGKNELLIETLKLFSQNIAEPFIYCYGEKGTGRSHLLQACCHLAFEKKHDAFYLSLKNFDELTPDIFNNLEQYELICIDDIECILDNAKWAEAFFHFYNRMRDNKTNMLISAHQSPQKLSCILPDLKSRLTSGLILEIQNLTDTQKIQVLKMRAENRGLFLSDDVANYLLNRFSRNMSDLFSIFETLDRASLATKRKLTIPFIKTIIF
ncbi:MAG: hypothetical protein ACD_29C00062G0003 [uncultured bacterium]|nr:MAG: hypothetical protein ACD_29C00062G0003 [uncultured bacterium]